MARLLHRFVTIDRQATRMDAEKRTIEVAFSSEYAVDRGDYDEILDHSADSVDMSRIKDGAPFLLVHSMWDAMDQIGVVDEARIESDRMGRAVLRFGSTARAKEMMQDVMDGIRRNISVGYERTGVISSEKKNNREIIRYRWKPFEISLVPLGADPNAGVGRSEYIARDYATYEKPMRTLLETQSAGGGGSPTAPSAADIQVIENKTIEREKKRRGQITAAVAAVIKGQPARELELRNLELKHITEGTSFEDFTPVILEASGARRVEGTETHIGMTEKDVKNYRVTRAIQSLMTRMEGGKPEPSFELDCHQEFAKKTDRRAEGLWIPPDVVTGLATRDLQRRDLNITNATQGGNLVATQLLTPMIELLRNKMVTDRVGVQTLSGLSGNIAIPRQTGAATAYAVTEQGAITESTQTIGQVTATPHRIGAWNDYSKQLVLQSSIDVENFVRNDLMAVLGLKWDSVTLEGGAANEPDGVLNTAAIGTVTFAAAPTWAKVIEFETDVEDANADVGAMAYVTTPVVKGAWKSTVKVTNQAVFLWEGSMGDGSTDGIVNGYRAVASKQISNNYVAFGVWSQVVRCLWGGIDLLVNPYTGDTTATVRVTVNTFGDVVVRHAGAFSWSTDAGNQ